MQQDFHPATVPLMHQQLLMLKNTMSKLGVHNISKLKIQIIVIYNSSHVNRADVISQIVYTIILPKEAYI